LKSQDNRIGLRALPRKAMECGKIYVADLGNIGTRYTTSNGFYLSIISAFLILLALTDPGKNFEQIGVFARITTLIFAGLLCYLWSNTIRFYRTLFRAKFEILREMEQRFPYSCYQREEELLLQSKVRRLTNNEVRIPLFLGVLFILLLRLMLDSRAVDVRMV
jgi:hypothetical protein